MGWMSITASEHMVNTFRHQGNASQNHKLLSTAYGMSITASEHVVNIFRHQENASQNQKVPSTACERTITERTETPNNRDIEAFRPFEGCKNSAGLLKGLAILPSLTQDSSIYSTVSTKK